MNSKRYNWEHPNWPNFNYSAEKQSEKAELLLENYKVSTEKLRCLPQAQQQETLLELLVNESYASSKIENIQTDRTQLRSSIATRLSLPNVNEPRDRYAHGMADLLLSMRGSRSSGLTEQLLFDAHTMCMHGQATLLGHVQDIGKYRTSSQDMLITNGAPPEKQVIYFKAPPSDLVSQQMNSFIQWFNLGNPKLVDDHAVLLTRIAIAHLWFESIHPFDDGNGRIGRAIADLGLCQLFGHSVLISLSTEIEAHKSDYYDHLNQASGFHLNIDEWNDWFIDRVLAAVKTSEIQIDISLKKHDWWQKQDLQSFNERQVKAINRMFDFGPTGMEGGMTARKYKNLTATSKATATRDLSDLEKLGVITRNQEGGRSTNYELSVYFETMSSSR